MSESASSSASAPTLGLTSVSVPGILADVTATFPAASATAIIGPSGAGKTTLLRILAGFAAPAQGSLTLDDRVVAADGDVRVPPAERRLGYLPQDLGLWDHLPARAHLQLVLDAARPAQSRDARRTAVDETLEQLGLTAVAKRRAGLLSGGERRRLALGRALVTDPALILLDEPFSGVDYELRDTLLDLLATRIGRATLVTVSHVREETLQLAQQVMVLSDGRIAEHGTMDAIRSEPRSPFAQRFFR